jgi:hypothetical protein
VPKFTVNYYTSIGEGKVYKEEDIEASTDVESAAIAAERFIELGLQITGRETFDVVYEDGGTQRVDGPTLRYFVTRKANGSLALVRLRAALNA